MLTGKRILLAVTGSIAAYKACDLIQRLKEQGCEVRVALSPDAVKLVHPNTFAALSGHAVLLDAWSGVTDGRMDHIAWARWADLLLVAPASAHMLAQLAQGLADTVIPLLALAFEGPVVVAPAMNSVMLHHPAVQANLATLQARGVVVLPTGEGVLACGEVGEGKLLEVNALVAHLRTCVAALTTPQASPNPLPHPAAGRDLPAWATRWPHLRGKRVVLGLGHTQEAIDAVRYISNRSSGKTGLALARTLWLAGASVEGVAGVLDQPLATAWQGLTRVTTSAEFAEALLGEKAAARQADVVIMSAAIADFVPAHPTQGKNKDSKSLKNIELKPSLHILTELGRHKPQHQLLVGFALETADILAEARRKLRERHCDFVVVNNPVDPAGVQGFGRDAVMAAVLDAQGEVLPLAPVEKEELAVHLLDALNRRLAPPSLTA